ncbi:MAG: hypothetical protein AAFN79_21450 [Pseudomonadota bacterium]
MRTDISKSLLAIGLIAGLASPVMAEQPSPQEIAAHLFSKADADGDGVMTAEEYDASGFSRFGGSFKALDGDVDGAVSEEEYIDAFSRHHSPGENI